MNLRKVTIVIDSDKCIGCGQCIDVCPSQTISLINGKAQVTGDRSLSCGHCAAVCPAEAVSVGAIDPEMTRFSTFSLPSSWMPPGAGSPAQLAGLMASRRSCRNFKEKAVSAEVLEDLVKFGSLAPSGTNSQDWTFTILSSRESVLGFGHRIKDFFIGLNKKAANPLLRKGLRLLGSKALDTYYQEYYESVSQAMTEMETQGKDRLFHGAAACILVGSGPVAACPKEDALLASGNILLAAHAMGLGTCLVGFAVAAMKADRSIGKSLNIPGREKIHAVIALGYPDETYVRITGRKKPVMRSA